MGITGLLPLLKPVTKDIHIRDLKGLTVGIDTYCWLHKGIYSCSAELCQGVPTDKFIKYCVERVHLLLSHGVKPYLVFDGGYLPAKSGKEEERRVKREANMQRGMQLLREGNVSGAHQFFSKAADVTPLMAHNLIQVIKRIPGVRYVVAPYEADAQLGLLARNGHVDAVITEDSDIILFGCTRVVFKLDRDGTGQEVDLREVFSRRNDELDMRGMNEDDLMTLCALSGCDYLPSVHGIGLKKAHRLVSRHKEVPKILRAVKFESAGAFPRGYEADFHRALLTFRHQRAFDPVSRTVVHMTPLPEVLPSAIATAAPGDGGGGGTLGGDKNALDFLGPPISQERGCAVADGEVDPITGEAFAEMAPGGGKDASEAPSPKLALSDAAAAALAAWRGDSTPAASGGGAGGSATSGSKKKLSAAQGNNLTKYWGTPLSAQKPLDTSGKGEARGRGGGSGSGGSGDHAGDNGGLGSGTTSGGGGVGRGTPVRGTSIREGVFAIPERVAAGAASPAAASPCLSPASFYAGVSPSPPPLPNYASDSEDKENRDPLLPHERLKAEVGEEPGTSKHFGGGRGRGGGRGGGLGAMSARSDVQRRKRFRSPLGSRAAPGSDRSSAASVPEGGGGDAVDRRRRDVGFDPWKATYAHPRLDPHGETEGVPAAATGCSSGGGSGSGGDGSGGSVGGSRLKRRRTLGVGSLAPRGLIRGLDGGALGLGGKAGVGGEGSFQRSKSLGAVSGEGGGGVGLVAGHGVDNENDDDDDSVRPTERCASNLFDRFAARPQPLPQPSRANEKVPSGAGAPEAAPEMSERGVTAAAAAAAADRDERDKGRDESGQGRDERGKGRDERDKDRDERGKDLDGSDEDGDERDKDHANGREGLKSSDLGGQSKVGGETGGGGGRGRGGGPLTELSVNNIAAQSVVTCRESVHASPLAVAKGGGGCGPGQACAGGGSGGSAPQASCGDRRLDGEEVQRGCTRAVCGGGGAGEGGGDSRSRSSSSSKCGRNCDASGKKPGSGRRCTCEGAEGVWDSHGGGGRGSDRGRSSENAGSLNEKATGGGSVGGGSGGVDGGDLFMRFMYNA